MAPSEVTPAEDSNSGLSRTSEPPEPLLGDTAAIALARTLVAESLPPAGELSPVLLAYIGDAVYELHVRSQLLVPPKRIRDYHQAVVARVRAESQAALLESWQPLLTEDEKTLVRRGRNATSRSPRRLSRDIYQRATGLEALIGYLFLSDPVRLTALLAASPDEPPESSP